MSENTELALRNDSIAPAREPSPIQLIDAAVRNGVTAENVAVVRELIAMQREEVARQNKVSFNRAFFRLKQDIAKMEFYADNEAKTRSGETAYSYCSESEISSKLEPVLFKHGFAMMFGQRQDGDRVIAEVTLIHEDGHEEKREYSVRTGAVNAMKDATAVDSGSTTSAWRHLVIKLFGLKSRIREESDARNDGQPISYEQAETLRQMVKDTGSNEARFLAFAGVKTYEEIGANRYSYLFSELNKKARK